MVVLESSYETRARFVSLVCSGWSLNRAAAEVGMTSAWSVKWWRRLAPMELKPCMGHRGGVALLPGLVMWPGAQRDEPRKRRALTLVDRQTIAVGLRLGMPQGAIADFLGRCKSVISREISRHRSSDGNYYADLAGAVAAIARARPKSFKLHDRGLCARIEAWMDQGWSPQLIARVLACEPGSTKMSRVSHETIYRALYVQSRGQLRKDLYRKLSLRRKQRKARGTPRQDSPYRDAFTIRDRPAEVADRAVPGHWEGDLILGAGNRSAVGTLVERTTRFVVLLHLPNGHSADEVAAAMIGQMKDLPEHLRRSITYDRGTEMARYPDIQLALDLPVYFCDPASPWQRGSNENTNGLLRQYLPKSTDLSVVSRAELTSIQDSLNGRPRKTLGYLTPSEKFTELVATTG